MYKQGLIILCLLLLAGCGAKTITEKEPNDNPHTPQIIKAGQIIRGSFKNTYDNDYYKILPRKSSLIQINVETDPKLDPELRIYNERHQLLKIYNYYGKGETETICNLKIKQEFLILKIRNLSDNTNGFYRVKITELPAGEYEAEPNNSLKQANLFPLNSTLTAFYPPATNTNQQYENDFFRLESDRPGNFNVKISVEPQDDFNPVLEIYNMNGVLLQKTDSQTAGDPEILRNIGFKSPGELYIKVSGHTTSAYHTSYFLVNEAVSFDGEQESEPNDLLHQATFFAKDKDEITGYIINSNDQDIYRISPDFPKGKLLNIVLQPPEGLLCRLTLMDSVGKTITTAAFSGNANIYTVNNIHVFKNDYYIAVNSLSNNANQNDYYILKKYYREIIPGLEKEPNNSFYNPQPIKSSRLYTAYLPSVTDLDFFEFNIYTEGSYTLVLNPIGRFGIITRLYAQDKKLVEETVLFGTNDYLEKDFKLQQGTYFISFQAEEKASLIPDTPYRFKIEPR